MARKRDPRRDESFELWKKHGGNITNREIAKQLDLPEKTIGGWKSKDKWNSKLNGVLQKNIRSTPNKKGGQPGNQNAKGHGAPKGNSNAVLHGLFAKYLPDETREIAEQVESINPLDILWTNIRIQFAQIMRAQQIMHVENKDDLTRILKKKKDGDTFTEKEWELQFAWDKQANFLNSQSRAMGELRSMLKQFYELAHADDTRLLELKKMRAVIDKTEAETEKLTKDDTNTNTVINIIDSWSDEDE
ncbi:phage terminase small subunit [Salinibacillus xinjiangensis]|uniref:PBSX phage terminase small subunit-like N-terminal domain-containing protein n=1 Tax=Salinibacillus xinjiangensis TaxID=1229268 RepID=A0A6G1X7P8_9BACI|nr:phage terminase small subunit [Salinibacillus xinjiangensis]MRG86994.1 hypothetical protein [Salinibacillus xinjiangensis]